MGLHKLLTFQLYFTVFSVLKLSLRVLFQLGESEILAPLWYPSSRNNLYHRTSSSANTFHDLLTWRTGRETDYIRCPRLSTKLHDDPDSLLLNTTSILSSWIWFIRSVDSFSITAAWTVVQMISFYINALVPNSCCDKVTDFAAVTGSACIPSLLLINKALKRLLEKYSIAVCQLHQLKRSPGGKKKVTINKTPDYLSASSQISFVQELEDLQGQFIRQLNVEEGDFVHLVLNRAE